MLTIEQLTETLRRARFDDAAEAALLKLGLSAIRESQGDSVGAARYVAEAREHLQQLIEAA